MTTHNIPGFFSESFETVDNGRSSDLLARLIQEITASGNVGEFHPVPY